MLVIRDSQLSALQAAMGGSFASRLAAHLRARYREQLAPLSDAELRAMIKEGVRSAQDYNLTANEDRAAFIELMFAAAPDFDSHLAIRRLLTAKPGTAGAPIRLLPVLVPEHVWKQVIKPLDAHTLRQWLESRAAGRA